ncbi:Hypothetical protein SRAE_1000139700 [Strongyloides ratti]|uniref:Uncharacterized protein n=1 Tax=Strongyloides ratti TaxID=34506 RepID=A0A090L4T8_STRRB|nr:Hypothetical protein SRAE_1000139700 [Strongyloides ratti]CEF63132.1 Hypothetical protein SRAE_1000139700 [Strongyloides ratti]
MQALEVYFQCFTVTSFIFAVIIFFLFSISKYMKKLDKKEKKRIRAINKLQETVPFEQELSKEGNQTGVESTRCQDTVEESITEMSNYETHCGSLINNQTEYFDISCCNQDSVPCHRHGKTSTNKFPSS